MPTHDSRCTGYPLVAGPCYRLQGHMLTEQYMVHRYAWTCSTGGPAHCLTDFALSGLSGVIGRGWVQSILLALREDDDDSAQVSALSELCEMLSISTEESLQTCPFDQLIPVLVGLRSKVLPGCILPCDARSVDPGTRLACAVQLLVNKLMHHICIDMCI